MLLLLLLGRGNADVLLAGGQKGVCVVWGAAALHGGTV